MTKNIEEPSDDSAPYYNGMLFGLLVGWAKAIGWAGQANKENNDALFNQANCIADDIVGAVPEELRERFDTITEDGLDSALEYLKTHGQEPEK